MQFKQYKLTISPRFVPPDLGENLKKNRTLNKLYVCFLLCLPTLIFVGNKFSNTIS
jgi:hypothetical protein